MKPFVQPVPVVKCFVPVVGGEIRAELPTDFLRVLKGHGCRPFGGCFCAQAQWESVSLWKQKTPTCRFHSQLPLQVFEFGFAELG